MEKQLALSRNFIEMLFLVTTVNIYQYKHNTWNRQTYYKNKGWWVHNPCCYAFERLPFTAENPEKHWWLWFGFWQFLAK